MLLSNPARLVSSLLLLSGVSVSARSVPRHATLVSRDVVAQTTYDFVIAGAGIAGLTVADRLTENPNGE